MRWKPSRAPITSRPDDQSASSIRFAGFRFHIPPTFGPPSKWRDPRAPRSRISPMMRSASAGSRSMTSPHHGWSGRESILLRASGQSSIGSRHASWAQYSKTRPVLRSFDTVRGG